MAINHLLTERNKRDFGYHKPDEEGQKKLAQVRAQMLATADLILELCPAGRDLGLSLDALKVSAMWACSAIACEYPLSE